MPHRLVSDQLAPHTFDAGEYAERVLAHAVSGASITVETARQQKALHRLPGRESVIVHVLEGLGHVGPMGLTPVATAEGPVILDREGTERHGGATPS